MLDVSTIETLKRLMRESMEKDSILLNTLRDEIRPLKNMTKRIFPRTTTSISLVGTDGGNNRLVFDPFIVQVIRVVDSSDNQYYMDVITPTTPIKDLNNKIISRDGNQYDALADMMEYLGAKDLTELSPMIHDNPPGEPVNASWVQVYRELIEWATLFSILRGKDFGTDTLIVFDGLLRSKEILNLDRNQGDVEAIAARSNMTVIVSSLHDPSSQFMEMLLMALSEGKLCVVDVSQLRGEQALILSGIILKRIFDRNQEQFTAAEPQTIPTIAVIEEAQSVLIPNAPAAEPYIAWVKEGRKYDLGALMITQQPGSIPSDILSQGDNWFIFHLLSGVDLQNVKRANAHFSDDILSSLLNEPIPGQGVMWSSVSSKPYPISLRVLSFEAENTTYDREYNKPAENLYAVQLREKFSRELTGFSEREAPDCEETEPMEEPVDVQKIILQKVVNEIRANQVVMNNLREGMPWGRFMEPIKKALPSTIMEAEKQETAFRLVSVVLNELFGSDGWGTYRENSKTFIKLEGEGET